MTASPSRLLLLLAALACGRKADVPVGADSARAGADAGAAPASVVETFRLSETQTVTTRSGLVWTLAESSHAHAKAGNTIGDWTFTVAKGGETEKLELSASSEGLRRFEGVVFGEAYVIEARESDPQVTLSMLAGPARKVSEDEAIAIARARYQEEFDQPGDVAWTSSSDSVARVGFKGDAEEGGNVEVAVGLYSGKAFDLRRVKAGPADMR